MFRSKDKRNKRTAVGSLATSLGSMSKPKIEEHWYAKGRGCLDIGRLEQLLTVDLEAYCPRASLEAFYGIAERYHRDELTEASTTSHGHSLNVTWTMLTTFCEGLSTRLARQACPRIFCHKFTPSWVFYWT